MFNSIRSRTGHKNYKLHFLLDYKNLLSRERRRNPFLARNLYCKLRMLLMFHNMLSRRHHRLHRRYFPEESMFLVYKLNRLILLQRAHSLQHNFSMWWQLHNNHDRIHHKVNSWHFRLARKFPKSRQYKWTLPPVHS